MLRRVTQIQPQVFVETWKITKIRDFAVIPPGLGSQEFV